MAWSMTSNNLLIAPLLLLSAYPTPSPNQTLNAYQAVEPHMGTLFRIKLYTQDETAAQQGFRAAFERITQLDQILSDYQSQSELSRISREAVGHPVRVSDDLFRITQASQELSIQTGGAFDLTIGPLTHLWRQARHDHALPPAGKIHAEIAHCGYQKLHLDAAAETMEFDAPGMLLDAGGIAKGYAADEALAVLEGRGLRCALVAASGDLAFGDAPPGQAGWTVGIDSFDRADQPFTRVLMLANAAVSTSGSSEQNLKAAGKTYSHIIDPKTGMGLEDDLTVTTIARHGLTADPAATAISVLGCDKGLAYANRQPDLAVLILVNRAGHVQQFESDRFKELFEGNHADR
jgi:thiamine biosynthesis lipoprotein